LDRLHEELPGENVVRTSFHQYLNDWLKAKDAETVRSTTTFYRGSLNKFVQFLGNRFDEPISEITKEDVVNFGNSLIKEVSAKTANHDLKALKMMFKSAPERQRHPKILPNSLSQLGRNEHRRLNAHLANDAGSS
jgi:site-specific recombinase XerD